MTTEAINFYISGYFAYIIAFAFCNKKLKSKTGYTYEDNGESKQAALIYSFKKCRLPKIT